MNFLSPVFGLMLQEASRASTALESIKHPDLSKFLVIAAILFIIGMAGVLTRRNIIVIFMSIELILNAANLNFIAFSRYLQDAGYANAIAGQVFTVLSSSSRRPKPPSVSASSSRSIATARRSL